MKPKVQPNPNVLRIRLTDLMLNLISTLTILKVKIFVNLEFNLTKIQKYKELIFSLYPIGVVIWIITLLQFGWIEFWEKLSIPSMYPQFADVQAIKGSLLSFESGFNPQIDNPEDYWDRPFTYPMLWVYLARIFDLKNDINFSVFVAFMIIAFILIIGFLLKNYPSLAFLGAIFSSATFFLVERGNTDIFIFNLLFLSIFLSPFLQLLILIIIFALKFYPALTLPAFRFKVLTSVLAISLMLMYLYLIRSELNFVLFSGPNTSLPEAPFKYGLKTTIFYFGAFLGLFGINGITLKISTTVAITLFALALLLILKNKKFIPDVNSQIDAESKARILFLIGSLIYLGTFIFLSNFDYKMIFLLFCFPLLQQLRSNLFVFITKLSILVSMNYFFLVKISELIFNSNSFTINYLLIGLNQAAKSLAFILLTAILIKLVGIKNLNENIKI